MEHARHPRVRAFAPVPLRSRADGWTPARQAAFLAALAITRSVREAARSIGMSRETAYRLRSKPGAESFAAAWDALTGKPAASRKVTPEGRIMRAITGLLKPLIYRGRHVATIEKHDNSALLSHILQIDRSSIASRRAAAGQAMFAPSTASTARPSPAATDSLAQPPKHAIAPAQIWLSRRRAEGSRGGPDHWRPSPHGAGLTAPQTGSKSR